MCSWEGANKANDCHPSVRPSVHLFVRSHRVTIPTCLCCHVTQPLFFSAVGSQTAYRGLQSTLGDVSKPSLPCSILFRLPGFGIYRAELGSREALGFSTSKLLSSSLLHKATLFSANPPRSGMNFFQMIQRHVNGKGRT